MPCSNTTVCESAFGNCKKLRRKITDLDFHCFWIWALQKRYGWILHSAFSLDYISSYICAFRGVRYGTCGVIQSISRMDHLVHNLDLTDEHKIFKNMPNIKLLTDIEREKAMGLVRGSTKANVTQWVMRGTVRGVGTGSDVKLGEGTFVKSGHATCLDQGVVGFMYHQSISTVRNKLVGHGTSYEDPSAYVYFFEINKWEYVCTIEELREANPGRFQRRHSDEHLASNSKENIAREQKLGLWRGKTKLRLWYQKKWYLCMYVKSSYIPFDKKVCRHWRRMREPYVYRFHWQEDAPKVYTNGPLVMLRSWNPGRVRPDGSFSEISSSS